MDFYLNNNFFLLAYLKTPVDIYSVSLAQGILITDRIPQQRFE